MSEDDPTVMGRGPVSISRILSLLVAVVYVVAAFVWGDFPTFGRTLLYCIMVVACIWLPESMGEYTGPRVSRRRPSAPGAVWLLGWIVLLLPGLICAYWWVTGAVN